MLGITSHANVIIFPARNRSALKQSQYPWPEGVSESVRSCQQPVELGGLLFLCPVARKLPPGFHLMHVARRVRARAR